MIDKNIEKKIVKEDYKVEKFIDFEKAQKLVFQNLKQKLKKT